MSIYSVFNNQVKSHPESPAIIEDGRTLTFAELDILVDRILSKIDGADPHKFIGIVMKHGAMQIAAMLAVLKSGAGYVPAEPSLPKNRIDYMMSAAGVSLVIDDDFCKNLPEPSAPLPDRSRPGDVAYILFTSGTTGRPKGVVIPNSAVVNYAEAFGEEMKVGPGDIMLQYSVCSFDIFVEEVFASLLNGEALAIPSPETRSGSLEGVLEFCSRHGVTIIDGFPYLLADINRQEDLLPKSVHLIISGGDVIRASYITNLHNKGIRIYNTYGPSETTVCSNYYRIDNAEPLPDGTYPVGKAVKGVEVRILGPNLEEMPPGQTGEICILGNGVGLGYIGNPPEQAHFVTLPDGRRMYRSGDLGYLLPDGNVAFLHRLDDQVMILGKRVEPEEVENVLNEFPNIERGVVRAFKDEAGLHYLIAYIVPALNFSLRDLQAWMSSRLVDFMVPEFYVSMDRIPVTPRGKIDVKALPVVLKKGNYGI